MGRPVGDKEFVGEIVGSSVGFLEDEGLAEGEYVEFTE